MKHFDVFYGMNTEDFQNLQTITELMYTAKTLYRNDRFISAMTRREMEQLLSKVKEDVQAQNKNVVFVDCSNGILYEARVVTYIGNVPEIMQNYKHKFIQKEDGEWYREALLGKCCVCGEYKELNVNTSKGIMCCECWARREI